MGTAIPNYPTGITFEQVWAAQMKTDQQLQALREQMQETDRQMKETDRRMQETDRQMKETDLRIKEQSDNLNTRIGHLTNLFGDLTVSMVAPMLCEKFKEFKLFFPKASPNVIFNDRVNEISFEVDILLENGDKAILVEVKTKATEERVKKHIERMQKMRRYADMHGDRRAFLGAVACFVVTDELKQLILKEGLYFIEYNGENFYITQPDGKPAEW